MTRQVPEGRAASRGRIETQTGRDADPQIDFGRIMRAMRRQLPLVAICAFAGATIAVLMILGSVPRYMAVETVLLDEERADLLNEVSPLPNAVRSDSTIQSEIEIIKSQALAYEVVDRLDLDEDPAFLSPPQGATDRVISAVMSLTDPLADLLSPAEPEPVPGSGAGDDMAEEDALTPAEQVEATDRDRAAATLRSRLGVSRTGRSFVIEIGYRGYDPRRSAVIARAYGEAYEKFQLSSTTEVASTAEEWLRERLDQLEQQSIEAAAAVQEFRSENDLVQVRGDLLTEQQQSELASELVSAAAATAEAKAQLDSMTSLLERARNGEEIVTVPAEGGEGRANVQELRRDYLNAKGRYRQLVEEFGEDHPEARQIETRIEQLSESIRVELEQATEAARVDYNVSRSREESLRSDLEAATSTTDENVQLRGRLQQLEAISETYSEVYRDYLQRLEVTLQQQGFPIASVKIISRAEVPKGASSPQKKAMLLAGLFLGGFVGIAIGAALELMSKPVRTASTLREDLGLACAGLLPKGGSAGPVGTRTIERLAQACEIRPPGGGGTLVALAQLAESSATDKDLPRQLAARLGRDGSRQVLLVDATRPTSGQAIPAAGVETVGLDQLLESYSAQEGTGNGAVDYGSLAGDLRRRFDHVLLVLPPLSRSLQSDPESWAYDVTLLRVPWGRVLPGFIGEALRDHPVFRERLATTVLEGAKLKTARRYMSPRSYEELETYA